MPIGAILGGASLIGGLAQASAANKAADAQKDAAQQQLALQERIYDETTKRFQPWVNAGGTALKAQNYLMGLGRSPVIGQNAQGQNQRYSFTGSPSYQFNLNEGLGAIEATKAAQGGLYSGAAMKAAQKYGAGLASNEFWNNYNALSGLSQQGQSAAGGQASAGQNYASGGSSALANYGNAAAAGATGVGNAINSGIGNAIGAWGYMNALKGLS